MTLEKDRFSGKFNFEIDVADEIEEEEFGIPPMLLQPYVENSIIHGVLELIENGFIQISLNELIEEGIKCVVDDNGVGRSQANENKSEVGEATRTSYGLGITRQKINLLNDYHQGGFDVKTVDKFNTDQSSAGTRGGNYSTYIGG